MRITLRIFLGIFILLIILLLSVWILLKTEWGNRKLTGFTESYLSAKFKAKVSIDRIDVSRLSNPRIMGVDLRDPQGQLVAAFDTLQLGLDIPALFKRSIDVQMVSLSGLKLRVIKSARTGKFNYEFMVDAFSGGDAAPADTSTGSWKFALDRVTLSRIDLQYVDEITRDSFLVKLRSLDTDLKGSDFFRPYIQSDIIKVDSLIAYVQLGETPVSSGKPADSEPMALALAIRALQAGYVNLKLRTLNESMNLQSAAGALTVDNLRYNAQRNEVLVSGIFLRDHDMKLAYADSEDETEGKLTEATSGPAFTARLDTLSVINNHYTIQQQPLPKHSPNLFEAGDMDLQQVNISASKIFMEGSRYGALLHQAQLKDGQGFEIQSLSGDIRYSDTAIQVKAFKLLTRKNNLSADFQMRYPSLDDISKHPGKTMLLVDIRPSSVLLDEAGYFVPSLRNNSSVRGFLYDPVKIQGRAEGSLDDLDIRSLLVRHLGNEVNLSAKIRHLMDPSKLTVDGTIQEVKLHKKDLREELGKMIPDSAWVYIPDDVTIKGKLAGNMEDIRMDLSGRTTNGNIAVAGRISHPSDKFKSTYSLTLGAQDLALQKIFQDSSLGPVTARLTLAGAGYDLATMRAKMNGRVERAYFNGYTYHDVSVEGSVQSGYVDAQVKASDPNMDLDLNVAGYFVNTIRDLMVDADLRKVNLQATGFMKEPLTISGKVNADVDQADSAQASGSVRFDDIMIETPKKNYFLDTMDILAYQFADTQFIKLNTPFAHATLKGQFRFDALPEDFKAVLNGYLQTQDTVVRMRKPAFADFTADVHIPDTLLPLIPGLKKLSRFVIAMKLDTRINQIILATKIPEIEYRDFRVDSLMVGIGQDETKSDLQRAAVAVSLERFNSPWVSTNRVYLSGKMDKGMFNSGLVLLDNDNTTPVYIIPFSFYNDSLHPYISLGDSLMLNKFTWSVNPGNKVYLNPERLEGSSLSITRGQQEFSVAASGENQSGLPLSVMVKGVDLESITALLNADSAQIKGEINASATFRSFSPMDFESELRLTGLAFRESNFGNLMASAASKDGDLYSAKLSLHGAGNDLDADGTYKNSDGSIRGQADIRSFNIQPFAPLVKEYADSLRGRITGQVKAEGSTDNPLLSGRISMDSLQMILVSTGTPMSIPKGELALEGRHVAIRDLTILDSAGRTATVKGQVDINSIDSLQYDLKVDARDFLIAGHKRYPNQLVYGPLRIATLLTVKGDQEVAVINGNVDVRDSSSVTYVYRETERMSSADGLIEFFNPSDSTKDSTRLSVAKPVHRNFAISANTYVSITPKSELNIVLNEESGDKLSVKGKSNLNFSMDASGGMELVGNYEVESGLYNLSIAGLIKKEFMVNKGSTITWTGDVKKANVNLTAVYKVKTDAAELVQDIGYLPGISKQKFDFLVYMDISGDLMKPNISFRLDMKEDQQAAFDGMVYTRIKQVNNLPSELNKQVMGLLALQTFIADNPFSSVGGGGNFQTEAFSTAGNLLTKELNNFIGKSIKDVDIDVGLDIRDDYSSGSAVRKSDLKVGLAKSFNNNRLNIYVGSTFALENQNQQQDLLNGLAGDVTLEYLLTQDGRFRLKGYRVNKNDLTFNGVVVETGATFVVVVEFNKLKNAFRKKRNP